MITNHYHTQITVISSVISLFGSKIDRNQIQIATFFLPLFNIDMLREREREKVGKKISFTFDIKYISSREY